MEYYILFLVLVILGLVIYLNVMCSIALYRTDDLEKVQKLAQALIVWFVPILGPFFILRLIHSFDESSIPSRWFPNDYINSYIRQALGIQARVVNRSMKDAAEIEAYEVFSGSMSSSSNSSSD
ncbi:hypothetical protein [Litoribacillus peritrichatus]|uniref:Uncharacterized protein n=1 Tax=Litoribacillus peritrichatus TaxID=718191 RepID=A0ABP7M8E4_9GAMM